MPIGLYAEMCWTRGRGMSKKLPKYLDELEIANLLNAPPEKKTRDRLIIRLLYFGGIRVSELSNLKIEDIDFLEGYITIRQGKGGKDRVIVIDQDTLNLADTFRKYRTKGYLIRSQKTKKQLSVRQIEQLITNYCIKAGIPREKAHPHALRHSFAVHSLKKGTNIRTLQKQLGHTSLTNTQIYLDILPKDIKDNYSLGKPKVVQWTK